MTQLLINLDVDDLERAIEFYTQAFDLKVGRHFGDWAELVGGQAPIYLLPKARASAPYAGATSGRQYDRHWTPVHLDFVVPDLELAKQKVLAAGAQVEDKVQLAPYGKLALCVDPFGHGFCLLEWEGKGYDELDQIEHRQA